MFDICSNLQLAACGNITTQQRLCVCIYQQCQIGIKIKYLAMQEESVDIPINKILKWISSSNNLNAAQFVLSCLGKEEISVIAGIAVQQKQVNNCLFSIASVMHFLNEFITKVDRSNYYLFYQEPAFKKIQQHQIVHITTQFQPVLGQLQSQFNSILLQIASQTGQLQKTDFMEVTKIIFFETDLPLPKMKRQTVGMHCESPLQDFLLQRRIFDKEIEIPWLEESLEELKQLIQAQLPSQKVNLPNQLGSSSPLLKIIKKTRFTGYKVKHDNWRQFLIQNLRIHNLIVLILAMCSQLTVTFNFLITNNADPFMRFTQFCLRSNVYRNMILAIEEKFGFLFKSYSQLYRSLYPQSESQQFNFTREALSIWVQEMMEHHTFNQKMFNFISSQMRQRNLQQFLIIKTQKLPSFFTGLKEKIEMRIFSESLKEGIYLQGSHYEVEQFFCCNQELYEIICKDYLEYMVDISVDEFNVHLCGHSKHNISARPLFMSFQEQSIHITQQFYKFCRQILYESVPPQIQLGILREVIKEDLQFISQNIVKPVILRSILEEVNAQIRYEVQHMPQYAVFMEEGYSKYKIIWDFQEVDNLLDYFCNKLKIGECPQKQKFYCQVQDQCVTEPSHSSWSSDCNDDQLMEEYLSEEEQNIQEEDY